VRVEDISDLALGVNYEEIRRPRATKPGCDLIIEYVSGAAGHHNHAQLAA
jgi:hypothetical protein